MTASKDMTRPGSQHRASIGSAASSLPPRPANARAHGHSMSLGSVNPTNRVSRRKSMVSTNVNPAAIAAAVNDGTADAFEPKSLPGKHHSAVVDGPPLASVLDTKEIASAKARVRRASDGSRLSKTDGRKPVPGELKCEKCGKAYKHSSCLQKHLWEHTPEWALTSKLLISKHQQVQLLEAASVLVAMNQDGTPQIEPGSATSEHSSASPPASASSEDDDVSSVGTTPPPQLEDTNQTSRARVGVPTRQSSGSSAFSRSYQSSIFSVSIPNQYGDHSSRPPTAATPGTSYAGSYRADDDHDFAVAMSGLKFSTPANGPTALPTDVPPVPEIPVHFAQNSSNIRETANVDANPHPYTRQMDMGDDRKEENSHRRNQRSYDEHDEGIFGAMEE